LLTPSYSRASISSDRSTTVRGVVERRSEDIDLFARKAADLGPAVRAISKALERHGYQVRAVDKAQDLAAAFDGMYELAVLIVSRPEDKGPDGAPVETEIEFAHIAWERAERTSLGLVVSLDDLAAMKAIAFASRHERRDVVDIAALLDGYTAEELVGRAQAREPVLTAAEFADSRDWTEMLISVHDAQLQAYLDDMGRSFEWIRKQFANRWPLDRFR
jgi:hypothetical protein